jgi:hypothetical protein
MTRAHRAEFAFLRRAPTTSKKRPRRCVMCLIGKIICARHGFMALNPAKISGPAP